LSKTPSRHFPKTGLLRRIYCNVTCCKPHEQN